MNKKKMNTICIVAIIISAIIGFLNPYEHYMTIIYSFWYSAIMFIYFISIKIVRKISKNTLLKGEIQSYVNGYHKLIESKLPKILVIGGLCFIKIFSFIIQLNMYLSKTNIEINYLENTFLLNNALLMFIVATMAETVVVITFSMRIWKEKGQGDEITICH